MKYEELGKGIVKRTEKRVLGLFIDGTGLDRASRRINRKVDMSALLKGVTSGLLPVVARYYTLIPYEDDSRQRAFLDAVARAGMQVIVKRLPPKGVTRQVNVDAEMAADIVAFSLGHTSFSSLSEYKSEDFGAADHRNNMPERGSSLAQGRAAGMFPVSSSQVRLRLRGNPSDGAGRPESAQLLAAEPAAEPAVALDSIPVQEVKPAAAPVITSTAPQHRIVTVVCPGRDLAYAIALSRELGVDTVNADFGQFSGGDVLKSAAKWIDLSDSETIWRD